MLNIVINFMGDIIHLMSLSKFMSYSIFSKNSDI